MVTEGISTGRSGLAPSLEYCALSYLDQWFLKERAYHLALAQPDREVRLEVLPRALAFFGVARNVPRPASPPFSQTYLNPILDCLEDAETWVAADACSAADVVERVRGALRQAYGGRDLLSLTTKLLWLRFQDPFVILDSRALSALGVRSRSYREYEGCWLARYSGTALAVARACAEVPRALRFARCGTAISERDALEVSSEVWFHRRVFDLLLWHEGGSLV